MNNLSAPIPKKSFKNHDTNCPKSIDFRRVWTDAGALSKNQGVSVWRRHLRLRHNGRLLYAGVRSTILSACSERYHGVRFFPTTDSVPPLSLSILWHDGNPKVDLERVLKPDPPKGYVAMGVVVGIGKLPPKVDVFCLREDAVVPAVIPRRPL